MCDKFKDILSQQGPVIYVIGYGALRNIYLEPAAC